MPAAAGTAAASAASAAALVFTTAFAVVATMAAAEAADAAAVPAAAGKASKCHEKQQTKKSQPHLELAPPLAALERIVEHEEIVQHTSEERLIYRQACHDQGTVSSKSSPHYQPTLGRDLAA